MPEFERTAGGNSWINPVDHDVAGTIVQRMTFDNGDPHINLTAIKFEQYAQDAETYHDLLVVGRHLTPRDHTGAISTDESTHEVYTLGANLALTTLDVLSERLDIDVEMFRKAWRINGTVKVVDLSAEKVRHMSPEDQYDTIAQGIMTAGHQTMDSFGSVYDLLLDAAANTSPTAAANPGVLRASFGFVLAGGLTTLNRILEELEIRRLTTSLDFEATLHEWAEATPLAPADRASTAELASYDDFADELDTRAFYSDESAEVFLGKLTERQLDQDEQAVEILNALALTTYPNDLKNFALDDVGEAFFYGSLLALDALKQHAAALSVDATALTKAWRGQRTHQWLYNMDEVPEARLEHIDAHVLEILSHPTIAPEYDPVLLKFSDILGHEEEEALAFQNGFHYVLATGNDSIRSCINASISQQVKSETVDLDNELKKLLGG